MVVKSMYTHICYGSIFLPRNLAFHSKVSWIFTTVDSKMSLIFTTVRVIFTTVRVLLSTKLAAFVSYEQLRAFSMYYHMCPYSLLLYPSLFFTTVRVLILYYCTCAFSLPNWQSSWATSSCAFSTWLHWRQQQGLQAHNNNCRGSAHLFKSSQSITILFRYIVM